MKFDFNPRFIALDGPGKLYRFGPSSVMYMWRGPVNPFVKRKAKASADAAKVRVKRSDVQG